MNNQRCAVLYSLLFLFLSFLSISAYAPPDTEVTRSNRTNDTYPVSVFTIDDSGTMEPYKDPTGFFKKLNKKTVDSIRSPEEIFTHNLRVKEINQTLKLYEVYFSFYLDYLPALVLAEKIEKAAGTFGNEVEASIRAQEILTSLFERDTSVSPAEKAIQLADEYRYNAHEKLNLFIKALYRRTVSDQDVMQMMSAWRIREQIEIYLHPYKKYMGVYQRVLAVKLQEQGEDLEMMKEKSVSLFSLTAPSMSSLLHEAFSAQRFSVFDALLKSKSVPAFRLNMPDFLHRSVLHIMSGVEWEKAEPYFKSFMRHHQLVDFNIQEYRGWTPLAYAVAQKGMEALEFIRQLLAFKERMQLDILDSYQRTMITLAVESSAPDLARLLHREGVPHQEKVSANNTFVDQDFRLFKFITFLGVLFDEFIKVFELDGKANGSRRYSYEAVFDILLDENLLKEPNFLFADRYYILFKFFYKIFTFEERQRAEFILAAITEQSSNEVDKELARLLKAIRKGEVSFLRNFFSISENRLRYINRSFFHGDYTIRAPRVLSLFSLFELRKYFPATVVKGSEESIVASLRSINLLVDAVRFNQPEIVSLLLETGASPVHPTGSFGIRDAIAAGILSSKLFLPYEEQFQRHIKIMKTLLAHPDVTKEFLNRSFFFGITYADLATMRGNLSVLRLLYAKGVEVSRSLSFWKTRASAVDVAEKLNFLGTAMFVLEQKLQKDSGNKELSKELQQCRRAFN